MAAVEEDFLKTQGFKDASIFMDCPECGVEVEFPFVVELLMTASSNTMHISAKIFGGQINEQPLHDHIRKRHSAEG